MSVERTWLHFKVTLRLHPPHSGRGRLPEPALASYPPQVLQGWVGLVGETSIGHKGGKLLPRTMRPDAPCASFSDFFRDTWRDCRSSVKVLARPVTASALTTRAITSGQLSEKGVKCLVLVLSVCMCVCTESVKRAQKDGCATEPQIATCPAVEFCMAATHRLIIHTFARMIISYGGVESSEWTVVTWSFDAFVLFWDGFRHVPRNSLHSSSQAEGAIVY